MNWIPLAENMDNWRSVVRAAMNLDDGQRNCPKHVEFYFKNKFEKLVNLVGFIMMDLQEVGCVYRDWIGMAQDRDRWRTLVSAVMNLRVP